ncbi:MAG: hypothetical protein ACI86M_002665 [Saprospiraceae bacterium]|jgi:hypothetical protein
MLENSKPEKVKLQERWVAGYYLKITFSHARTTQSPERVKLLQRWVSTHCIYLKRIQNPERVTL